MFAVTPGDAGLCWHLQHDSVVSTSEASFLPRCCDVCAPCTWLYRAVPVRQAKSSLGAEASRVRNVDLVSGNITPEIGHDVVKLWEDEGVQKAWAKKASFVFGVLFSATWEGFEGGGRGRGRGGGATAAASCLPQEQSGQFQ